MDFTWKIGGEAGFGIMTTGLVFSKLASRSGYHLFDYITYPSLIRGGHNSYEVRVSDKPIHQLKLTSIPIGFVKPTTNCPASLLFTYSTRFSVDEVGVT